MVCYPSLSGFRQGWTSPELQRSKSSQEWEKSSSRWKDLIVHGLSELTSLNLIVKKLRLFGKVRKFQFCCVLWTCDVWDVVDAGDGQHVEDDVGAADVQHRQEIENKTCSFLSWGKYLLLKKRKKKFVFTNPASSLPILDRETWYKAAVVNCNAKYDNDGRNTKPQGKVTWEIQSWREGRILLLWWYCYCYVFYFKFRQNKILKQTQKT